MPDTVNIIDEQDVQIQIYESNNQVTIVEVEGHAPEILEIHNTEQSQVDLNEDSSDSIIQVFEQEDVVLYIYEPGAQGPRGASGGGGGSDYVLPSNVVSSSAQIALDISGSFVSASNSISSRLGVIEGKSLFSSSQQVNFSDISGSFTTSSFLQNTFTSSYHLFTSSMEQRLQRLEAPTSSYAIKTEVSGAFNTLSSSLANRITVYDNKSLISGSEQVSYTGITNIPSNIVSGSEQLTQSYDLRYHRFGTGLFSASQQVQYSQIGGIPSGILSSSTGFVLSSETSSFLRNDFSSSTETRFNRLEQQTSSYAQISTLEPVFGFTGSASSRLSAIEHTTGSLNTFTGSLLSRIFSIESFTGSYSTTGSNIFVGNQTVTGSTNITGSLNVVGQVSGTFVGSGVGLTGVQTSSYAITASYALNGGGTTTNIQTVGGRIITYDSSITPGSKGYRHIGYNCSIVKTRAVSDTVGSIYINVKRAGTTLGTISLTNQSASIDTVLTGWTTSLTQDDLLEFYVSQSSINITNISFFLDVQSI